MSIYVRTISIYRPSAGTGGQGFQVGLAPYEGLTAANQTLIFSNIPASIQAEALGNTRSSDLPAGSPGPVKWSIYIPRRAPLNLGDVLDQDVVVDDVGERYQVAFAYYNLLGYKLGCIRISHAEA